MQGVGNLSEIETDVSLDVPMLPGRDFVTFPGMRVPLFIGRPKSIGAVDRSLEAGGMLFLVAQRDSKTEQPRQEDLYELGTLVQIEQCERRQPGTIKILIGVRRRARLEIFTDGDCYMARVSPLPENDGDSAMRASPQVSPTHRIGDRLRARHPKSQETEALMACNILNRMITLGRPESCAIVA